MSGVEALAVLSIACNVMQVISFSHETISFCKKYYENGRTDPGLDEATSHLTGCAKDLEDQLHGPQPRTKDQSELMDIAQKCHKAAIELTSELSKMSSTSSSSKLGRSLLPGFRRMLHKSRIESLEKDVTKYQSVLETRLLMQIYKSTDASTVRQHDDFQKINDILQHFINAISQGHTHISDLLSEQAKNLNDDTTKKHEETRAVINEHTTKTQLNVQESMRRQAENTRLEAVSEAQAERFLKSLKFPGMNQRYNSVSNAFPRTFQWLFGDEGVDFKDTNDEGYKYDEDDEFLPDYIYRSKNKIWNGFTEWIKSDSNSYWISGKAGSGKSTLMKFLLDDGRTRALLNDKAGEEVLVIAHFLWISGTDKQRSIAGLLSTLLYAVLSQRRDLIRSLFNRAPALLNKDEDTDWSESELEGVLFDVFQHEMTEQKVCLFIDGLDEVHLSDGPHKLLRLLDRLKRHSNLRICVSSRPEKAFNDYFAPGPYLRLQELTAPDIRRLAIQSLKEHTSFIPAPSWSDLPRGDRKNLESIIEIIVARSDGVILWVILAIRSLERGLTNRDDWITLERRLNTLPQDLHGLYVSMWNRLDDDKGLYKEYASTVFHLVIAWEDAHRKFFLGVHNDKSLRLLSLYLLLDEDRATEILTDLDNVDEKIIRQKCIEHSRLILSRCSGLLELHRSELCLGVAGKGEDAVADESEPHIEIRFIHRTAREFLLDTTEGQQIMSWAQLPYSTCLRRVLIVNIASATSFRKICEYTDSCPLANVPMGGALGDISRIYYNGSASQRKIIKSVLSLYHTAYRHAAWPREALTLHILDHKFNIKAHFLGLATAADLIEYVNEILDEIHMVPYELLEHICLCSNISWGRIEDLKGLRSILARRYHTHRTTPAASHQRSSSLVGCIPLTGLFWLLRSEVVLGGEDDADRLKEAFLFFKLLRDDEPIIGVFNESRSHCSPFSLPNIYISSPTTFDGRKSILFAAKPLTVVERLARVHQGTLLGELLAPNTAEDIPLPEVLLKIHYRVETRVFNGSFHCKKIKETDQAPLQKLAQQAFPFDQRDKWKQLSHELKDRICKNWDEDEDVDNWWEYLSQRGYFPPLKEFQEYVTKCQPPNLGVEG